MEKTLCERDKAFYCFTYVFCGIMYNTYVFGEETFYGDTDVLMVLGRLIGIIIFLKLMLGAWSSAMDSYRNFISNRATGSSNAEARRVMREQEKEKRRQQREYANQIKKSEEATLKMMLLGLKAFERFVTFCNGAAEWVKYYASKAKAKIQEFRAKRAERKAEKAQRKKEIQAQKFDIRKMG